MLSKAPTFNFSIIFYLLIFVMKDIISYEVGDHCMIQKTNETGTCALVKNCPAAIELIKKGAIPQTCSFHVKEPVVCCAGLKSTHNTVSTTTVKNEAIGQSVLSKIEQKCRQYARYTRKIDYVQLIESPTKVVMDVCEIYSIPLILGGDRSPTRYPHMALIGFNGSKDESYEIQWECSGSLISEDFVVTAAHCLYSRKYGEAAYVRLGDASNKRNTDSSPFQDFTIIRQIRHPAYKPPSLYNDIGLLQLNQKAILSDQIRPICLPANQEPTTEKAELTTWTVGNVFSDNRSYLDLYRGQIIPEKVCNTSYKSSIGRKLANGINYETQICLQSSSIDICDETSGGPLQIINKDVHCSYKIIGISSFGFHCSANRPRVFTRVSYYSEWIEDIVFGQE